MSANPHPVDEFLPIPKLLTLGLQHVLVMYAGAVAVRRCGVFWRKSRARSCGGCRQDQGADHLRTGRRDPHGASQLGSTARE
jgi:hypothetical protein